MKFTNGMFEFPIRIYDGFSVRRALKREEEIDVAQDMEWAAGYAEIPLDEYNGCRDFFDSGRDVKDVSKGDFDGTLVMTKTLGDFICIWSRNKLKDKLNSFADTYIDDIEKFVESELSEKPPPVKKNKWFNW